MRSPTPPSVVDVSSSNVTAILPLYTSIAYPPVYSSRAAFWSAGISENLYFLNLRADLALVCQHGVAGNLLIAITAPLSKSCR